MCIRFAYSLYAHHSAGGGQECQCSGTGVQSVVGHHAVLRTFSSHLSTLNMKELRCN